MFDHFDLLAVLYDRAIPFSGLELLLKITDLPTDGILLDVGGGTGRVANALKTYTREVFVVDFSRGMLAQANAKVLKCMQTPAEKLPFATGTFERIIMVDALHHVHQQAQTAAEMWRVLKAGGLLVIEEPDIRCWQVKILALVEKIALMRSHFFSPPEIAQMFPAAAKKSIRVVGYNAWIIIRKPMASGDEFL